MKTLTITHAVLKSLSSLLPALARSKNQHGTISRNTEIDIDACYLISMFLQSGDIKGDNLSVGSAARSLLAENWKLKGG